MKSNHKVTFKQVMKLSLSLGMIVGALIYIGFFFFGRICSVSVGLIAD